MWPAVIAPFDKPSPGLRAWGLGGRAVQNRAEGGLNGVLNWVRGWVR